MHMGTCDALSVVATRLMTTTKPAAQQVHHYQFYNALRMGVSEDYTACSVVVGRVEGELGRLE
ncbi:Protein of unknown function [Pyronema omphalodes CBS 100304]|uniref:Uncharacterized protein n=1 Tax=Pyronema omphalodes (strain CBS 100304) TaxID=1076935 RepID=U4LM12_PYROM|nr:Protein of unknown function [Pyronema omphalodes CBS 100304]